MAERLPSSASLWLEEALSGWILPVAALAAVGVVGLLYLAGFASEEATATLVVVVAAAVAAVYVVRPALDPSRDVPTRGIVAGAAALTLVATALPALRSVRPGDPIFAGEVTQADETIPVPAGFSGQVRLLVSGKLADRGEPVVTFTIAGTKEAIDGKLERTFGYARVGRGGRARVAHDHTADFYPASIPPGTRALTIDRLQGPLGSPLRIAVYREPIPVSGGPWLLALFAVALAAVADARLGLRNNLAVTSGMAAAFGLLVTYNATPAAAVGPAVGGVILGALGGSLGGWVVGAVVRRFVPAAKRRVATRAGGAAVAS